MNVQAAPPTYTPVGGSQAPMGNPPVLGSQVPGTTGGLPAQSGLSAFASPTAQQLQSMGRGEDTMLVHMTPGEVNSLQGLATASGGSLTINPQTGLPEAGWLGRLLPSILGVALAATGVGAPLAAGIVGLGQTALTGSLKKGLMAGLGAFGGASLAGAAGIGGALSKTGFGVLGGKAGILGANMGAGAVTAPGLPEALGAAGKAKAISVTQAPFPTAAPLPAAPLPTGTGAVGTFGQPLVAPPPIAVAPPPPVLAKSGFLGRFGETARQGLPGGIVGKAAPMVAGMGLLSGVSDATRPSFGNMGQQVDNSYQGPYYAQARPATFTENTADILGSSKERDYFAVDQPETYNLQGQVVQPGSHTAPGTPITRSVPLNPGRGGRRRGGPMFGFETAPYMGINPDEEGRFASGGAVNMRDGSFVVDARTVSEIGNGSSNAGIEALLRMGGSPVRGPGDGVSDSVRASIGGRQEARVARDEVIFQPEAVRRVGGGSGARGTKKLYALMDKAHKARKKAKRGQDTRVRRGLA